MNPTRNTNPHILLVDDERTVLALMHNGLTSAGYICNVAESVDEAKRLIEQEFIPELVVLDQAMPNKDGLVLAEYLSKVDIPFIMLTAYSEQALIDKASQLGALGYLVKPISVKQLIPAIDAALVRATELSQLKLKESQLSSALASDRDISIAIGLTMEKFKIDRKSAFEQLRASARKQSKKLATIAKEIIDSAQFS
jgi:response regulator NasT